METTDILEGLSILLVALLAGSMLFFSFVMAPLIFIKLESREAGKLVRAVFPWYYLLIIVLSLLGSLALLRITPLNAGLLAAVAISTMYSRQILMPSINHYRDRSKSGEEGAKKVFDKLHLRSEILNVLQILTVVAVLVHLAFF